MGVTIYFLIVIQFNYMVDIFRKEITMEKTRTKTTSLQFDVRQLALTGLMTAVICILGPISLKIPISPVDISLGTLAIYFAVSVLGTKSGTLSVAIYILLGLAGLPVFTGFMGGPAKLFGPSGGYIIGYLFMTPICGLSLKTGRDKFLPRLALMLLGTLVLYLFGSAWMAYQLSLSFPQALMAGVVPYIPGDFIKILIAMTVGKELRTRLLKAGLL